MSEIDPISGPQPFPNPARTIRLNVLPFGRTISRDVFKRDELAWMDEEVRRIVSRPELWVPALMAHVEAHRILTLDIGKLARASVGAFGMRLGYPLRAPFVASWNVYETLWRHYLDHKEELAAQLRAHPYEAEVLRNSKYFAAAISGILAEFGWMASAGGTSANDDATDTKTCPFCAETIKAKAVVCRYCGRNLPAPAP